MQSLGERMSDIHPQAINEENQRARLDRERVRRGSLAGRLRRGAEPPGQRVNPRAVERAGCAPNDIFARSRCGDRLDQRLVDPPSLLAVGGRNRRKVVARRRCLSCRGQARERFERPRKRRFAELRPECVATGPVTLFEGDDLRCRLATRKLRDFAELLRQKLLGERVVMRARDRRRSAKAASHCRSGSGQRTAAGHPSPAKVCAASMRARARP